MLLSTILPTLGLVGQALAVSHSCFAAQPPISYRSEVPSDKDVKGYFDKLAPATKKTLLHDTTGPESGADVGVVAAAIPDPNHPGFSVYRLRDALLVYHPWLNELTVLGDESLRPMADDLTHALIRTQQGVGLAGNVFTGGIEEVMFDVKINPILAEESRYSGSPAADGPPLRASVLLKYAEWLIKPEQNNGTWVTDVLWPKLNLDLQWIATHWNTSSWDLWWPPVLAGSYWTASLQYRALRGGACLGRAIGRGVDVVRDYDSQASMILDYMQTFWNENEGFMTETTANVEEGRSGYGSAPLMVSVYNFDPSLGCDDATFQPCSPRALSSLKVVGDHFKEFFPISRKFSDDQPPFFGFFTEDQFLGGHPQFFSSFNSAEQLYDSLITWDRIGRIDVTRTDIKFWRQLDPAVKIGSYRKGSKTYNALTKAVHEWANKIVLQLAENTPEDYVLVQCVHKEKGGPYGPRGMIRSLAAALGVYDAYNGLVPPNWGHPIPERQTHDREDVSASAEEVTKWDADHDDEYRGVAPDLHRNTWLHNSPSWV